MSSHHLPSPVSIIEARSFAFSLKHHACRVQMVREDHLTQGIRSRLFGTDSIQPAYRHLVHCLHKQAVKHSLCVCERRSGQQAASERGERFAAERMGHCRQRAAF
ncbi:hypothetical protein D3C74_406520 [compost metagenome]